MSVEGIGVRPSGDAGQRCQTLPRYSAEKLMGDELIAHTYSLDEVNDIRASGTLSRVILFD